MYNTTLSLTSKDLKQCTIFDPDYFPKELHLDCSSGTNGVCQGSLEKNTIQWVDFRWETIYFKIWCKKFINVKNHLNQPSLNVCWAILANLMNAVS